MPSPVLYGGKIWVCSSNNEIISCYDAHAGTLHYTKQRIEGLKGVYASPVAAADRVYFAVRNGVTAVIKSRKHRYCLMDLWTHSPRRPEERTGATKELTSFY